MVMSSEKMNVVHMSGKRKKSIARATLRPGSGIIRINNYPLDSYSTEVVQLKIKEAIVVASDYVDLSKLDISVVSQGGGVMGQADAIASAIARGLVEYSKSDELLARYHQYNRTLIAGDSRRTEPHKPSQSSKGPRHKRQKSYR